MICTLRDELAQRCLEIIELESALSSSNQQVILNSKTELENLFAFRVRYSIHVHLWRRCLYLTAGTISVISLSMDV